MNKNIPKKAQLQAIISKLSEDQKKCANHVLKLFIYFNSVFVTQARIARDIGMSRKTVCKYMGFFHEIGLFVKRRRYHPQFKLSNITSLPQDFFTTLKDYLSFYFPVLLGWSGTPLYAKQSAWVTLRRKNNNKAAEDEGVKAKNSSSSQDLSLNLLPQSIQQVGAEYSTKPRAYNYPKNESKPKFTYKEWAPSSMEEWENFKKFDEETDTVPDFVESPTLNEIKTLLTIPDLIDWVNNY